MKMLENGVLIESGLNRSAEDSMAVLRRLQTRRDVRRGQTME